MTLALMDAVHISVGSTLDLRGPEARCLSEEEIVGESQHLIRDPATGEKTDSNLLPKEEPTFNGSLLAAVILASSRPFLFNPYCSFKDLSDEEHEEVRIVVAVLLMTARGREWHAPGEEPIPLEEDFIRRRFGPEILSHVKGLIASVERVCAMTGPGADASVVDGLYHDAVAAVLASRLRLAIRTVGEGLMNDERDNQGRELLGTYRDGALRKSYGVADDREYLRRYTELARTGVGLAKVSDDLRRKVVNQLILPSSAVINSFEVGTDCFAGKEGTIPVFQNMLDLMRLGFDYTHPFANALGAYFELARYAERSRRRDGEPLMGHVLRVQSAFLPALRRMSPTLWRAALFHDYIEDNIWDQGYSAVLFKRTGAAAFVAFELSDPDRKGEDDVEKARKFNDREKTPRIKWACDLYGEIKCRGKREADFIKEVTRPANPDFPYTIEAAVLKLADFMDTMKVGLSLPERMGRDGWRQSGKRIGVHINKEAIILNLVERLAAEGDLIEKESGVRVGNLLRAYADISLRNRMANLAIVCRERGIDEGKEFQEDFFRTDLDGEVMKSRWGGAFETVAPSFDKEMAVSLDRLIDVYRVDAHRLLRLFPSPSSRSKSSPSTRNRPSATP
jgi:hypothetical protein